MNSVPRSVVFLAIFHLICHDREIRNRRTFFRFLQQMDWLIYRMQIWTETTKVFCLGFHITINLRPIVKIRSLYLNLMWNTLLYNYPRNLKSLFQKTKHVRRPPLNRFVIQCSIWGQFFFRFLKTHGLFNKPGCQTYDVYVLVLF